MRRSPLEEAWRWLSQAEADLEWAALLAREGGFHLACFLAQQIAEKALKALLYARGAETVFGHSVARLCAEIAPFLPEAAEGARRWSILDTYYIPTRYPNGLPDGIPAEVFTRDAAGQAVSLAREIAAWVRRTLSGGGAPPGE